MISENMTRILLTALAEFGVHEIAGPKSNPTVDKYLGTVGMAADDDISWCSAFINWCCEQNKITGTKKANARSWLTWGSAASGNPGDICVLWRGSIGGWQGHVGILVHKSDSHVLLLAGNQGDAVSISSFPIARVLGYRAT